MTLLGEDRCATSAKALFKRNQPAICTHRLPAHLAPMYSRPIGSTSLLRDLPALLSVMQANLVDFLDPIADVELSEV